MIKIFKKNNKHLVRAKVRICARFDEEGYGSYVLKSGLSKTTHHDTNRSGYIIDFQEPVTWSKSIHESMHITVYGFDVVHLNEQLNHLMIDFINTYDTCYNSVIHPFYVITDVDYGNEKNKDMVIEYSCEEKSELNKRSFTPYQVFMTIAKSYFVRITECVHDGLNFKAKISCTESRFDNIKRELFSILASENHSVLNIDVVRDTKRKFIIRDLQDITTKSQGRVEMSHE